VLHGLVALQDQSLGPILAEFLLILAKNDGEGFYDIGVDIAKAVAFTFSLILSPKSHSYLPCYVYQVSKGVKDLPNACLLQDQLPQFIK
jgi:hypothetical protein